MSTVTITKKTILEASATLQGLYDLLGALPAEIPLSAEIVDIENTWIDHEHAEDGEVLELEEPQEMLFLTLEWPDEEVAS